MYDFPLLLFTFESRGLSLLLVVFTVLDLFTFSDDNEKEGLQKYYVY